ncbi:uncharacterized protein LAJ45_10997 [Morchella importuna]|uniref:uncharacterized protein n=1 Tax=Morchella importuna TaxID=1174673 RepID=UPI001E8E310A|nr:uncharacterized protein LAJ45_10997 [Morchella importuna]KAH8144977.1 hypothetical protein LAJ45_10997 [Morchella importuna]
MAAPSYGHHPAQYPQTYHAPSIPVPNAPPGTFLPGTLITVGAHKCTIERYLSEGGFAHVYLVKLSRPVDGLDVAVLKRVAVPDKEALTSMRTEVETMKRLKGHRHIVTYIDSHASHLKGGGYEVFLLMEFCSGGGLIDFMNTRLQNRLTEPEILKIFDDVAEGVACMHYLQPPLLHRDLKVENVLIGSHRGYKLCDFGSCAPVKPAAQTVVECRLVEEDIQKHTTLQYRSPEMVDVYRKLPIDEKSDIWALGVLLYKLCYYTTPFEEQGTLAILNASFKFPSYPPFSDRIKKLIAWMLREAPQQRPNIYQVVREVCSMRGKQVPIKDIYSELSAQKSPVEPQVSPTIQSPPSIVAYQSPPPPQPQPLPDITPMRRGRPTKDGPVAHSPGTSRTRPTIPDPSPKIRSTSSDPFSALDQNTSPFSMNDSASRFPSVEQFNLLHDSGNKFEFVEGLLPSTSDPGKKDLSTRLTEKLADDAFASAAPQPAQKAPTGSKQYQSASRPVTGHGMSGWPVLLEPQPTRPVMVSTGTMTSPESSSSRSPSPREFPMLRTNSKLQEQAFESQGSSPAVSRLKQQRPTTLLEVGRSATHTPTVSRTPNSSRPSLEYSRSASTLEAGNPNPPPRSASVNSKQRPTSVFVESNLEFLRDLDSATTQGTSSMQPPSGGYTVQQSITGQSINSQRSVNIESNVDYLKAIELESDVKPEKRGTSGNFVAKHVKRASMPSISLPSSKGLLAGKFGDAFRRFERNNTGSSQDQNPERAPSPERGAMPVITDSQDILDLDDYWEVSSQDVPPEMKRELEKRRLSQEERRVAAAAAEYKRQLAERDAGGKPTTSRNRANSIQNKVKALLSENRVPPPKTAEGYGRYTNAPQQQQQLDTLSRTKSNPTENPQTDGHHRGSVSYRTGTSSGSATITVASSISSRKAAPPTIIPSASTGSGQPSPRPPPPPKPNKLRVSGTGGGSVGTSAPQLPPRTVANGGVAEDGGINLSDEDWQKSFAKRYPSLAGLEMVETVVGPGRKD